MSQIRKELKAEFPASEGWKLSVTKRNHSTVEVAVMTAPIPMTDRCTGYEQINPFYISRHYEDRPQVKEALERIYAIINQGNRTVYEDADYGSVPKFYVSISIGKWRKPFELRA